MTMKRCTRCRQLLAVNEHNFHVALRNQDGSPRLWKSACKACANQHRQRLKVSKRARNAPVDRERGLMLDIAPFRAWLQQQLVIEGSVDALVATLGVSQRRVYHWLHHGVQVHIDKVDAVLLHHGGAMLRDLYPHLWDDLEEAA